MHSFIILALISDPVGALGLQPGVSGPIKGGIIGGLEWVGLRGVGAEPNAGVRGHHPAPGSSWLFQMMFAVITPALITGAFAERKKFSDLHRLRRWLWATLVYDPLAHWVWGDGGWLAQAGARSTSRAAPSSTSPPASRRWRAALVIGKRKGYGQQPMPPHNLPLDGDGRERCSGSAGSASTRGSALGANGLAVTRLHRRPTRPPRRRRARLDADRVELARQADRRWAPRRARSAGLGGDHAGRRASSRRMAAHRHRRRSPASSATRPATSRRSSATTTRSTSSACTASAARGGARHGHLRHQDSSTTPGRNGLLYGDPEAALEAVRGGRARPSCSGFVMTVVILKVLDAVMGLRVSEDDEMAGLDLSQHSETAYALGGSFVRRIRHERQPGGRRVRGGHERRPRPSARPG
mgnify:CR=1 FL=1